MLLVVNVHFFCLFFCCCSFFTIKMLFVFHTLLIQWNIFVLSIDFGLGTYNIAYEKLHKILTQTRMKGKYDDVEWMEGEINNSKVKILLLTVCFFLLFVCIRYGFFCLFLVIDLSHFLSCDESLLNPFSAIMTKLLYYWVIFWTVPFIKRKIGSASCYCASNVHRKLKG